MPKVIIDIPGETIPLLLQITEAMGIANDSMVIKDEIPDWHSQILNERLEKYKASKTDTTTWENFEKELDNEDEVNAL